MSKSKIKIKTVIFYSVILSLCLCAIILCFFFPYSGEPNHRRNIYKKFQITIPEEWNVLYFNQGTFGGFDGRGKAYYVFDVPAREEDFLSEFSQEKNEELESLVLRMKESGFDLNGHSPIETEYLYDSGQSYEWYKKTIENDKYAGDSYIIFIYQSDRMYTYAQY